MNTVFPVPKKEGKLIAPLAKRVSMWVLDKTDLDKVLIKAVVATVPPTNGVHETSVRNVNVSAHKARPRLRRRWLGAQKIALSFLCESTICIVASEIRKMSPLQHESAGSGESVRRRAIVAPVTENEIVVWDTGRSIECVAQVVGKVDRLLEEGIDFARLPRISISLFKSFPGTLTSSQRSERGPLSRS